MIRLAFPCPKAPPEERDRGLWGREWKWLIWSVKEDAPFVPIISRLLFFCSFVVYPVLQRGCQWEEGGGGCGILYSCCRAQQKVIIWYQTQNTVFDHILQIPRRGLKCDAQRCIFWQTSRCLEMRSNTVFRVWYIFSIETKTKQKTEKYIRKNLCWQATSEFPCASVSTRVSVRNHSFENDFHLHEHETTCRTYFHIKGFALTLVFKLRHKRTRKWSIKIRCPNIVTVVVVLMKLYFTTGNSSAIYRKIKTETTQL